MSKVLKDPPLDPTASASWPSSRPALESTERHNVLEAFQLAQGMEMPINENPVLDARQTIMAFAKSWDAGRRWVLVQDSAQQFAICIRPLSVLELKNDTPAFVLLYQSMTRASGVRGVQRVRQMQEKYGLREGGANVTATPLEQKLLLKLLAMNGKLLSTTYEPERDATERNFKASFMPPLGPLGYGDIGKLNNDPGCVLCGKKTGSRCKQCMSVFYCGSDCQRADRPQHKHVCRSLKDGTWRTVRFVGVLVGTEGMHATRLNRFSLMSDIRANASPLDPNAIPANVYGDRFFLVKISIRRDERDSFEIYDLQSSIDVHFIQGENPELFDELIREMRGPRGNYSCLKMYRWAKRIGDWELSICVDKEPQTEIKW